ncbi:hypothetical protein TNCV_2061911 [Trichonephila clavipes]|nr:hypothetical protein TNCV_2061911 [Trichonephila clavipes]
MQSFLKVVQEVAEESMIKAATEIVEKNKISHPIFNVGNLNAMQQNVIAALYHCASSNKKPMHGQCPIGKESWCYFQRGWQMEHNVPQNMLLGYIEKNFQTAFLEKVEKQDLILLAEDLGMRVSDKKTIIDFKNITGRKDYEEEFVKAYLSVISEERVETETEEKNRQATRNRTATKNTRYRKAEEHVRGTSPVVLTAETTIPVTTPIKEEKGINDSRVVHVKGEQGIVNAAIDTGAQIPVVRTNVVEGQSVDNRGTIQITSAFWEHDRGELKGSNMENNDLKHGVIPVPKNLVNGMFTCSDYGGLIENSQLVRNPAILRVSSKKEEIINSVNLKPVCSQEVVTETYTVFIECSKRNCGCSGKLYSSNPILGTNEQYGPKKGRKKEFSFWGDKVAGEVPPIPNRSRELTSRGLGRSLRVRF